MPTTTTSSAPQVRTYGNWRRPRTPGLPGLGLLGTVVFFAGVVLAILGQMIAGWQAALVIVAVTVVVVAPLMVKDRSGRNAWQILTAHAAWTLGVRRGQNLYRSCLVASPVPGLVPGQLPGATTLPGLLARSSMHEAVDSFGQAFALLHVPATRHYSVVLRCDPEGSALVDPETTDTWVAQWGRFLAALAREPNLVAASATVESAPDPGNRLAREVDQLIGPEAPQLSRAVLQEVAATYAKGSPQIAGRVSLTFSATRDADADKDATAGTSAKGASVVGPGEMAAQIGRRLPGLIASLAAAGAGGGVRAMTASEVAEMVRVAYDPAIAPTVDAMTSRGQPSGITWAGAGPLAQVEGWSTLRHDSGISITSQMTDAPPGAVESTVLRSMLEPTEILTRKRVTLLYRPHDPAAKARITHADVRTAKQRATVRAGENREADSLDLDAARQAAREAARGAGLTRFALLSTATVLADDVETAPGLLGKAAAVVDQAASSSEVTLRRVYGAQSASFAAALGIGIVLDSHVATPAVLRDYL